VNFAPFLLAFTLADATLAVPDVSSVGALAAPAPEPAARANIFCGHTVAEPAKLPPPDSPPVILALILCFEAQGGVSLVDPATYLYYIQARPSEPSRDRWLQYDGETERTLHADFRRLWDTGFLDDLSIEVESRPLANGVIAKILVFRFEERQRVKIVEFKGAKEVSQSDIEKALKERSISIRLDSFLDSATVRQVSAVVRQLYAEKGFQFTTVEPSTTALPGGPKLVNLTFQIDQGPRVAIRDVEFVGNRALDDATLAKAMKGNKSHSVLSVVSGRGVYRATEMEEDVENVVGLYRDRGYIDVRVGQPDLRILEDSEDRKIRWVQLRVPVEEGRRYRVGTLTFDGNTKVPTDRLISLFKIRPGEVYSEARVRMGLEKAREIYGAGGYFEFTAFPDLQPRNAMTAAGSTTAQTPANDPPTVDVTVRVKEGEQYFVRRITFVGNTNTKDEVVRRELAIVEAGVFNTEALKLSVRRLNQLGYFKPIEDEGISVEKVPNTTNRVDVQLKVEEQNRNQINVGAGASQYDGFFGTGSFTTANFMGRGESLTFAVQKGARTGLYQFGLTEPYFFDRPISAGINVFSRKIDYAIASDSVNYSEVRTGASLTAGYPLRRFTRLFTTYRYEIIETAASDTLLAETDGTLSGLPFSVLQEGRRIQSSVEPALVHDTVDNPYMPRRGVRLSGGLQFAGTFLGGTTDFIKPEMEAIVYVPQTSRTAFGFRGQIGWIRPLRDSSDLPYYLRYALGGETQIRGVNIRSVGPLDSQNAALGGDKFVLFNGEYYVDVIPQTVRALLFHDAGQAFVEGAPINLRQLRTSSGVELRVVMPVLNVPFRLIYAWNIYRDAFQPARTFKFAVGTTF
jgi:outer membrane protein insertion porin family